MPKKSLKSKKHYSKRLKHRLKRKRDLVKSSFQKRHTKAHLWLQDKDIDLGQLRQRSARLLTGATLTGSLLLTPPGAAHKPPPQSTIEARLADLNLTTASDLKNKLVSNLKKVVTFRLGHADLEKEEEISDIIYKNIGIKATPQLDGQRLNHSIGYIGYEQHLKRYPGDDINQHDEEIQHGVAPGLGAWGYFTFSKNTMSQDDYLREKYYFAVQTLYLPTWNQDVRFLREWYKYRKMIAINLETGEAVVGVVGDSGPADWVGKQYGGSPEVMRALDLTGKKSKGKILLYFVDDPENKILLGPVIQPANLPIPQVT